MSDFNDGIAVGMAIGRKKFSGGGQKHDSIFHDILDNSELGSTVVIDDTYKFTFNSWLPGEEMPILNKHCYDYRLCAAEAIGMGYDQSWVSPVYSLYLVRILWRDNNPLYASIEADTYGKYDYYSFARLQKSVSETNLHKYYKYIQTKYEYIKGSTEGAGTFSVSPRFWVDSTNGSASLASIPDIDVIDDEGNRAYNIGFRCKIKRTVYGLKDRVYDSEMPEVILSGEYEDTIQLVTGSPISISPYYGNSSYGVFTDLTPYELELTTDEVIKAICEKYGGAKCYTHERPELLSPIE